MGLFRGFGFLAVAILAVGLGSSVAEGHSFLVQSEPAADSVLDESPQEIVLWFSTDIDPKFGSVEVKDPTGKRFDNDDLHGRGPRTMAVTLQSSDLSGIYTVVWKALSAVDGQRTTGSFVFFIGTQTAPAALPTHLDAGTAGPPGSLQVISRWLTYASMFSLIGAVVFPLVILAPARRRAGLKSTTRPSARAARVVLALTISALVASTGLTILVQLWSASESFGGMFDTDSVLYLTSSRLGRDLLGRAGLTFLTLAASIPFALRLESILAGERTRSNIMAWLPLLASALALPITVSLASHAAGHGGDAWLASAAFDWIHLIAGGLWIGGLLQFLTVFPAALAPLSMKERAALFARAVPRFSVLAMASVTTLALTGIIQWWIQLGDVRETVSSGYGQTLIVKMALLTPLLGLGALNLLVVQPSATALAKRIAQLSAPRGPRGRRALAGEALQKAAGWLRVFRRNVTAELTLGLAIIAVTAVLANSSPPIHSNGELPPASHAGGAAPASPPQGATGDLPPLLDGQGFQKAYRQLDSMVERANAADAEGAEDAFADVHEFAHVVAESLLNVSGQQAVELLGAVEQIEEELAGGRKTATLAALARELQRSLADSVETLAAPRVALQD